MLAKTLAFLSVCCLCTSGLIFGLSFREKRQQAVEILTAPQPIDLGIVNQGKTIPFVFQVKNTTSTPITIVGLVPSCGCTWLDDVQGASIASDNVLSIRGTLDTNGRRGEMGSYAVLKYRALPADPERTLILKVRATVRPTLRLDPESITIDLVAGSSEKIVRFVAIDSDQVDAFTLYDPESSISWMTTQVLEWEFHKIESSGRPARLKITIDPTGLSPEFWMAASTDQSARVRTSIEAEPLVVIPIRIHKP